MNYKNVTSSLGNGGKITNEFIDKYILKYFSNGIIEGLNDSANIGKIDNAAFTTDSFVIEPEFFPGGNIGDLSVYGTCNDLAVSGAKPEFLSFSIILPEGYAMEKIEKIIKSTGDAADNVGVKIVCGDTKVIPSGGIDTPIINTSGLGFVGKYLNNYDEIQIGDNVILTSDIARHGMAVLAKREELRLESDIESDCANLFPIFSKINTDNVTFSRDATRGGVAGVLNEISEKTGLGFIIEENKIPLREDVRYITDFLGFDPLDVANEGVAVIIAKNGYEEELLEKIKTTDVGKNAKIVGEVTEKNAVTMKTAIGGFRNVEMPSGDLLPRIC